MGVDLSHARNLTQDQVDEACGDGKTRLPNGLSVHTCGAMVRVIIQQAGAGGRHPMPAMPAIPGIPAPPAPPPPPPPPPTPTRYFMHPLPLSD